jgi:hypothetical protein
MSVVFSARRRRLIVSTLLAGIVLYGGLLRLDALFRTYGPYERPSWLAAMQPSVAAAASTITPNWPWHHDLTPYEGGDPINYLKFAREMRNFYAAHVREPMFPAMTRVGLMLTGDEDVGISITSIIFGLLTLVATYALGASVASPAAGLAAAAMLSIDQSAVYWSIGGWRDELFAFFAVSSVWAWLRLARRPSNANAILAGVLGGGACLTRITSVALLAPPALWLISTRGPDMRRKALIATGITAALAAPFVINCVIATGDPLYAINHHTDFYLKREGATDVKPTSAIKYSFDKFALRPFAATDNAVRGIFVYPFANKWVGLDKWYPGLGTLLAGLAIGGLVAWLWQPHERLLLFTFLVSLVPFSMTWTVRGGAEWRLTLFAYSFYLVAAFWLLDRIVRVALTVLRQRGSLTWPELQRPQVIRTTAVLLCLLTVAAGWPFVLPYAAARESLIHGDPMMIRAGQRDLWFFANGWSEPVVTGNVTTRSAIEPTAALRIVLPEKRSYELLFRIDPVVPQAGKMPTVRLAIDDHHLGDLVLSYNPERVSEYHLTIPADTVEAGIHRLLLRSDASFKLWYVLITPGQQTAVAGASN